MKNKILLLAITLIFVNIACAQEEPKGKAFKNNSDLKIQKVEVTYDQDYELIIFSAWVAGQAGQTYPEAAGQLNGAPVLGYVFPTNLRSSDVGFSEEEGIVAMAITAHPDFDDTPLWDENMDRNYANDGRVWHAHWVILGTDGRVPGGLSVKQFDPKADDVLLPPTNPGMPMFMDSPGFQVVTKGDRISVIVPAYRMNQQTEFKYDGAAAYMEVNTENKDMPMLGVYAVYSVASGDLSLPYEVKK